MSTHLLDFSGRPIGEAPPAGVTPWQPGVDTWDIVDRGGVPTGRCVAGSLSFATGAALDAVLPTAGAQEAVVLVSGRGPGLNGFAPGVVLRYRPLAVGRAGYLVRHFGTAASGQTIQIIPLTGNTTSVMSAGVSSFAKNYPLAQVYALRARLTNEPGPVHRVQARIWKYLEEEEPATWEVDATHSAAANATWRPAGGLAISAGGTSATNQVFYGRVGFGSDGDAAPLEAGSRRRIGLLGAAIAGGGLAYLMRGGSN